MKNNNLTYQKSGVNIKAADKNSPKFNALWGLPPSLTFTKNVPTIEHKIPVVSATQTTRSGYSNTDVGLEDTSESFGLPATADLMFAIISTEQME